MTKFDFCSKFQVMMSVVEWSYNWVEIEFWFVDLWFVALPDEFLNPPRESFAHSGSRTYTIEIEETFPNQINNLAVY